MAPQSKVQRLKSKILAEVERWNGIAAEIPFLEELGTLEEAIERGKKRKDEVDTQISATVRRLESLSEEEKKRRAALEKEVSERTRAAQEVESRAKVAAREADKALAVAEEGARARAQEIIAAAHVDARKIVVDAEARFADARRRLSGEVEALEKRLLDMRSEEEKLREAITEARALRKKLAQLESA